MKPLEGIRIIDFTQAYSGNFCAMHLADFGAEVIKIERYGSGDQARQWAPFKNGHSGYYATFCRGKKSLAIDLRQEEGKQIIRDLVKDADVVTENFKVGSMDRLGLGYEELKKINPKLIYASISGYGLTGPLANLAAYDNVTSAESGIMDITGFPENGPLKIGPSIGDNYTGTQLFMGICIALQQRARTGTAQRIDIAMMDTLLSLMDGAILEYTVLGKEPTRHGNSDVTAAPYGVFETNDGHIALGVATEKMWVSFCNVMGKSEWIVDPLYKDNDTRLLNVQKLTEEISLETKKYGKNELEEKLIGAAVPCHAVLNIPEVMNSEQTKARDMVVTIVDDGVGEYKAPGVPIKFSENEVKITKGAPLLGADSEDILKNILNYSDEQRKDLKEKKVY